MNHLEDELNDYLNRYAANLTNFDAHGGASMWGTPGLLLDNHNVGVAHTREEMAAGLEQGYPFYRKLGLDSVDHEMLSHDEITDSIVSVRVRWRFYDSEGELLTDGTNVYVLRRDDDGLHAYFCIATDEAEKLRALAEARGVDLHNPT